MMKRVLKDFSIDKIKLIGYSLGSGLAARAAEKYEARELVLIAPYFKFDHLAQEKIFFIPKFLVKYKIPTVDFIRNLKRAKVTIVHGSKDSLIDVSNSVKLSKFLKDGDGFFIVDADHNDILNSFEFERILSEILSG